MVHVVGEMDSYLLMQKLSLHGDLQIACLYEGQLWGTLLSHVCVLCVHVSSRYNLTKKVCIVYMCMCCVKEYFIIMHTESVCCSTQLLWEVLTSSMLTQRRHSSTILPIQAILGHC